MLLAETSGDKYISSFLTLIHKKELEKSTSQYFKFSVNNSDYLQKARKYGNFTGYKN